MSIPYPSDLKAVAHPTTPRWVDAPSMPRKPASRLATRLSWMGTPTPRVFPWVVAAPFAVIAAFVGGLLVRQFGATQVFFAENGPVELLQAGFLVLVALVYLAVFRRSSDSRALFCIAVAYAILFAVTREIPRCGSAFYDGGVCLTGGWKTGTVIAASLASLVALCLAPIAWRRALRISNLRWVWPIVLVAGIIVVAEAAEALIYIEIEESLELAAYVCLGAFGLQILSNARRQAEPQTPRRRSTDRARLTFP